MQKTVGENIKEVRSEKGLSQEELARLCDFSNTTLSSYENNRKTPGLVTIARIAKALGVSIERLYYGDENISFIFSEPDVGKRIVNAIYYLWSEDVIKFYEDYLPGVIPTANRRGEDKPSGIYLYLVKYPWAIKHLIESLDNFRERQSTFADPDKFLEMILNSAAQEINDEIGKAKDRKSELDSFI